jgi:hypothetical protein
MDCILECPHCASSDVEVIKVADEQRTLAVDGKNAVLAVRNRLASRRMPYSLGITGSDV